jgi:GntR family transcriptional regulator, phosphonate transport system regulatory protein
MLLDNLVGRDDEALMTQPVLLPARERAATLASGVALWRQVADHLARSIASGIYRAGSKLPGEIELAEAMGVNRHTVRRALAELSTRGLVRAARGSGTYVQAQRIPYPIGARTRFSEIVGASGRQAGGRLIASASEPAPAELARRLAVKPGAPLVRLELLRHADRVPICVATTWLSASRFPEAARIYAARRSVTATLAHFGVTDYQRASTRVSAALADIADIADSARLQLDRGSPILLVESLDIDRNGEPILATRARFAADRVEFVVES